jgi:quinol-cytochrome oxidoreductase complex cytochrome b subunit
MTLQDFFIWIISGGGAAILAYGLLELIAKRVVLSPELKRYLSIVAAALFSAGAFGLSVLFGYEPQPATWQAWLEAIFFVIGLAYPVNQAMHGAMKLRKRDAD